MKSSICGYEKIKQWTGLNTPACMILALVFYRTLWKLPDFSTGTEREAGPKSSPELDFFVRQTSMSLCDSWLAVSWANLSWNCGPCALTRGVAQLREFRQGNPYCGRLVPSQPQAGERSLPPIEPRESGGCSTLSQEVSAAPDLLRIAGRSSSSHSFWGKNLLMRFPNKDRHF